MKDCLTGLLMEMQTAALTAEKKAVRKAAGWVAQSAHKMVGSSGNWMVALTAVH